MSKKIDLITNEKYYQDLSSIKDRMGIQYASFNITDEPGADTGVTGFYHHNVERPELSKDEIILLQDAYMHGSGETQKLAKEILIYAMLPYMKKKVNSGGFRSNPDDVLADLLESTIVHFPKYNIEKGKLTTYYEPIYRSVISGAYGIAELSPYYNRKIQKIDEARISLRAKGKEKPTFSDIAAEITYKYGEKEGLTSAALVEKIVRMAQPTIYTEDFMGEETESDLQGKGFEAELSAAYNDKAGSDGEQYNPEAFSIAETERELFARWISEMPPKHRLFVDISYNYYETHNKRIPERKMYEAFQRYMPGVTTSQIDAIARDVQALFRAREDRQRRENGFAPKQVRHDEPVVNGLKKAKDIDLTGEQDIIDAIEEGLIFE